MAREFEATFLYSQGIFFITLTLNSIRANIFNPIQGNPQPVEDDGKLPIISLRVGQDFTLKAFGKTKNTTGNSENRQELEANVPGSSLA